ncbi:hypothetical protein M7I_0817 [Glarea lozoyensis 74030]|uniref:TauD/TfdA-like domain-containing protein n=1 Tax=Glarea lozoyensis (strain ATCC 74030 / MF5533) TaxID=1104152 RepID=H0EEE2_GLAL7|nr:hypothetical protein M7I_0817 [Glarea lozoyensis 74030]
MAAVQTSRPAGQPDIDYAPDLDKYLARTQRRLQKEPLHEQPLPEGFPKTLVSDFVWEDQDLEKTYQWVYELNDQEIAEIEEALGHFKSPQRGRQDNTFDGKPADVVLNHIKDLSLVVDKSLIGAPAYTADKQVFHTDSGDVVSLFALNTSASGGQSKLASTWRVYNELAATRPDLIRTLSETWVADNFENKQKPYLLKPLLFHQPSTDKTPERVILQYARRIFTGYQALPRSANIPPITEAQAEALDALHYLGERFHLGLDVRQGDIQYVNNLALFHARDGFVDTPEQQRHLIRLWLRDPEHAWPTPEVLSERWSQLYDGVTPENQVFPLEPRIRSSGRGQAKEEKPGQNIPVDCAAPPHPGIARLLYMHYSN